MTRSCPPANLVGGVEGQGLTQAQKVFGYTRLMVAAFGLGGGWSALDRAIAYSTTRIQGGAPLSEKQGYTHKLIVPHAVRLEAARAFIEYRGRAGSTRARARTGRSTPRAPSRSTSPPRRGTLAADAAIQAHGGYGYTREYLVEKIRRDVRITTIYEGTSEIMEMTIARDRWQQHLKSAGRYYRESAAELRALHARHPDVGAGAAALASEALAAVLEACRVGRLTRNQHVLLRLGELIAARRGRGLLRRPRGRGARRRGCRRRRTTGSTRERARRDEPGVRPRHRPEGGVRRPALGDRSAGAGPPAAPRGPAAAGSTPCSPHRQG